MYQDKILSLLHNFETISLAEMQEIRLMNRLDTKYLTTQKGLLQLLPILQPHYYVQEHQGYKINNYATLYFDTKDDLMYLAHHNGRRTREKIRIREYIESDLSFFEIKDKSNTGRTEKKRIRLEDNNDFSNSMVDKFLDENAKFTLKDLCPKLKNKFYRITFVNRNKTERLTIDFNIKFHNLTTDKDTQLDNLVVIELKQDKEANSQCKEILSSLKISSTGFSKFCVGSTLTNSKLKNNLFKQKIRFINKLTQFN